jgi:hypothetical protein
LLKNILQQLKTSHGNLIKHTATALEDKCLLCCGFRVFNNYRERRKDNHHKFYNQSSIKKRMGNFNYKEQHAVIVKCSSEEEQKKLFEKLKSLGFNDLKVVSV